MVILVSCNNISSEDRPTIDESQQQFVNEDQLFRLTLHIEKLSFRSDEKIELSSTLEYIGPNTSITIWHGLPYIDYYISDGKEFNVMGMTATILTHTTLDKGKVYTFQYIKSGGYSEDDPHADFWKKFYDEKDLYLPPGKYTLGVATHFSLTADTEGSRYSNNVEIEITVH